MTRLLRRLTAALTAAVPSALPGVVPHALPTGADAPVTIVVHGTLCWEVVPTPDCYITVELSSPAPVPVTVELSTADGTATAGADYSAVDSAAVTVPAGMKSVQVLLDIVPDKVSEDDEWFWVTIANPSYGEIVGPRDQVTILDGAG